MSLRTTAAGRLLPSILLVAVAAACAQSQQQGGAAEVIVGGALVAGDGSLMSKKSHGSTEQAPQSHLRWGAKWRTVRRCWCRRLCRERSHTFMRALA
jgi:hypothetical protein